MGLDVRHLPILDVEPSVDSSQVKCPEVSIAALHDRCPRPAPAV